MLESKIYYIAIEAVDKPFLIQVTPIDLSQHFDHINRGDAEIIIHRETKTVNSYTASEHFPFNQAHNIGPSWFTIANSGAS